VPYSSAHLGHAIHQFLGDAGGYAHSLGAWMRIENVEEAVQTGSASDAHTSQPSSLFHQCCISAASPGCNSCRNASHAAACY
jgi:hypothetical protein